MSATLAPSPTETEVRGDGELVVAARAGDQAALVELFGRHERRVAVTCARWLRQHEVADATQETFARAIDRLDALRDPDAFGPWLRAIARNVARDACVQDLRVIAVPGLHEDAACSAPGPDLAACTADDARGLHQQLAALSDRDRRALWLRDAHGVPIPEVADELGLTEGSTRVMLTRARRRLRESLRELGAGVAGVFGWWRLELQRLGPSASSTAPAWAAAIQVGAVAVALAIPLTGPVPVIVDDVPPAPQPAVSDPGAQGQVLPTPEVAQPAVEAPDATRARGGTPAPTGGREPAATAGPVEVGGARPDGEPLSAEVGSGDDAVVIELFPGNLLGEASVPGPSVRGVLGGLSVTVVNGEAQGSGG